MAIEVFPQLPGQGFWAAKGPSWNTLVKKAASGRQVRVSLQGQPIWQFKIGYKVLRDLPALAEIEQLWAFFNTCAGQLQDFYLLDPYDNLSAVNPVNGQPAQQQVGVGDGATTTFQLTRMQAVGSPYPFVEPVYGVVPGSVSVFLNGTVQQNGWSVGNLGVLTFTNAPAAGTVITWSGQFYFLCHFTEDDLAPAQMMADLWSLDGLTFESLIP